MRNLKKAAATLFALAGMTAPLAAAPCATVTDMAAFRTAAVQQQLMVAALTCQSVETYNRFVIAYRPELEKSDADLKAYFIRGGSEAAYDTFKTKLANLSSLSTIADRAGYCANAAMAFSMALKSRQALSSFVADQRLMIAMPKQTQCLARPVVETAAVTPKPRPKTEAPVARLAAAKPEAPRAASIPVRMAAIEPAKLPELKAPEPVMVEGLDYGRPSANPYGAAPPRPRAQPAQVARYEYRDAYDDEYLPPRPERPRMTRASRYDDYYYAPRYPDAPRPRDYRYRSYDDRGS